MVLKFASNHSECVVDEVVVDVDLQHNIDDDDVEDNDDVEDDDVEEDQK